MRDTRAWALSMVARRVAKEARLAHEAKLAQEDAERARLARESDPRVKLYYAAKARKIDRDAVKMAEARREYDALIASQERIGRGGRPRGRGILVGRDPANALVEALEGQR